MPTNREAIQRESRLTEGLSGTVAALAILERTKVIQEVPKECVLACNCITLGQQVNLVFLFTLTLVKDPFRRSNGFPTMMKYEMTIRMRHLTLLHIRKETLGYVKRSIHHSRLCL